MTQVPRRECAAACVDDPRDHDFADLERFSVCASLGRRDGSLHWVRSVEGSARSTVVTATSSGCIVGADFEGVVNFRGFTEDEARTAPR